MSKLEKMPDFATEREEADWWFQNQDAIAEEFAEQQGLEYLLVDKADVEVARAKARALGISTEAYVRNLFHKAIQEEAA